MWLRYATVLLTWLTSVAIAGLAGWFLWAARDDVAREALLAYGFVAIPLSFVMLFGTIVLRHRVSIWLMERGDFGAAMLYGRPRCYPSLAVGRDEAASNRYAVAEALRRQGQAAAALATLDGETTPPRGREMVALLALARASALADLGREEQAKGVLEALGEAPTKGRAKAHLERVRASLSGDAAPATEPSAEVAAAPSEANAA